MPALLCDTPWLNRESPYLFPGYNSCWFATVSPGGLTLVTRCMPEELRWCPGISRRWFAPRWIPVIPGCFKNFETTGITCRWTPIQHGVSRYNAVLAGVTTVWSRWAPVSTSKRRRDWKPGQCEWGLMESNTKSVTFKKYYDNILKKMKNA